MPEVVAWFLSVNWWEVTMSVAIPVAAILIPTVIAVRLARNERSVSVRSHYLERRHGAARGVIVALSDMISMDPTAEMVEPLLRGLRGSIAVYRASLTADDAVSGHWLVTRQLQGAELWTAAHGRLAFELARRTLSTGDTAQILQPAHMWAHDTMETFSEWLSGQVQDADLQADSARLIAERGSRV
ncbi:MULTISPECIES: hypothetical protein [unclassified Cryobacterium]|uniref:hypothetical protein n=1 Tax=unclassified Cryobacterium TaxID=2649013 RepID=UPI000CE46BC8|nr:MULTISPECIES: hypothetical protein [unclassified Cryobacterium]TFC54569.1 hypothetical protein E3O68_09535 [Cryobacterium sp. TMB3-1-2]TFC70849.1 hypothetical protein E3T21_09095 [Cryobacterium sp. TMB3-15]TFC77302.1 hypothetical protein E3T22_06215 [Cryobacterium sp. TMB3-10]TFD45236.1 hypothetical protein E3T58_02840 [Cryobacterium sp. TMB3-12]